MFQLFALELLDEVLGVFEVVRGLAYQGHMCMSLIPPSPYLQQVLHQHHLGNFFQIFCLV